MDLGNPSHRILLSFGIMVVFFILTLLVDDKKPHVRNNKLANATVGAWFITVAVFVITLFQGLYVLDNQ